LCNRSRMPADTSRSRRGLRAPFPLLALSIHFFPRRAPRAPARLQCFPARRLGDVLPLRRVWLTPAHAAGPLCREPPSAATPRPPPRDPSRWPMSGRPCRYDRVHVLVSLRMHDRRPQLNQGEIVGTLKVVKGEHRAARPAYRGCTFPRSLFSLFAGEARGIVGSYQRARRGAEFTANVGR